MIKKIIYTIGFLMFLSGPLMPLLTHADTAADKASTDPCTFSNDPGCRFPKSVKSANSSLDWGDSFGETDPKKVGKGLYKIVYAKTQIDPQDKAMQATADQYGMRIEKMRLIVGGDVTPILERNPILRVEDATRIYNDIVRTYNDKKNSIDLEANIKAKVEPNEIFADGDLKNSGFDLINDLSNIEIILFKKSDPVTIGGAYSPDSGGDNANKDAGASPPDQQNLPLDNLPPANGSDGKTPAKPPTLPPVPPTGITPKKNPFDIVNKGDKSALLGGVNPNQCFTSSDVKKALDDFQNELDKNAKLRNKFVAPVVVTPVADPNATPKPPGGDTGTASNSALSFGDSGLNNTDNANPAATKEIPAAAAGDWDQNPLCSDIACVTLEFVKKPVVPGFTKIDNCIQCHIQYINDALQKTLAHSLIPGKATGNLGESGLCKNAAATSLGSVGMNVSLSLVPMILPVKNEMADLSLGMGISGKAIKEAAIKTDTDWELFMCKRDPQACADKKLKDLQTKANGGKADNTPQPSAYERELLVAVSTSADGADQNTVWNKGRVAAEAVDAATAKSALIAAIADDSFGQADSYQALNREMKQMNSYFDIFQKLFRTLLEDVPGLASSKACDKLKSKETCS